MPLQQIKLVLDIHLNILYFTKICLETCAMCGSDFSCIQDTLTSRALGLAAAFKPSARARAKVSCNPETWIKICCRFGRQVLDALQNFRSLRGRLQRKSSGEGPRWLWNFGHSRYYILTCHLFLSTWILFVCKILLLARALGLKAARPSALATIGHLVYNI